HAPLRGIFGPNSGYIAHYAPFIWPKSPTKRNAQLPESNFQTRSRKLGVELIGKGEIGLIRYANSCGSVFTYNIGFLLSIILYEITNDEKLKENLRFKDLPCEDSKKSERETLREQIINEFETAKDMVLEYELLQMKASAKLKEALEAKKNAIIHGIEYG
ncbi:DUF6783 domain-containing protein, partial [Thomasclavelia cocleata]|uniref:DUF6783 domain-containing protein n=1 Tax=Thomasclavelia cocleata TaxID=69824 RepID=UPI0025A9EFB3